ncbi:MAG: GNAT family N-acetyltransferase [Syntrophobacterales bacterium]|jgi:GNAT superfamily N-acetyltransferase
MKHHLQDNDDNVAPATEKLDWKFKVATDGDVNPAVEALSVHMNDPQRAAFRDKLQRYVRNSDRELIVAVHGGQTIGLVCVIEQAQLPPRFPEQKASQLRNFACGTQLLVHPSFRKQGVGGSLLTRAEVWAHEHGLTGFWIVTHRKAAWYRSHFGYQEIGRIDDKGVEKIVLAKTFE